jgi:TrmH family RNA methyltransferase
MFNAPELEGRLRRVNSRQNARVKELRRSFAEAAPNDRGEVAVEGMHLAEEAIRSGLPLGAVFFSEAARDRAHKLLPQLSARTEALLLPDDVFAGAVPSETPQGIAALVRPKVFTLDDMFAPAPALLVVAAGLQDPGNLGVIARSAEAFGATGLLLGEGTVSPWNWKALRASAGSLFRLPTVKVAIRNALDEIASRGVKILATSSHKGTPLSDADLRLPMAFLVGNEGAGIAKELLARADDVIAIPQSARVESLNAGIAASIVLYEAARQRREVAPQ